MRLSSLSLLSLAAVLLISSVALAQHSGGGGGSSGGGSSGGGGSHGSGVSISSGSSAGNNSAGGSVSHASGTHSSSSASSSSAHLSHSQTMHGAEASKAQMKAPPEKRGFFSRLLHPSQKHEPKPVADRKHRICFNGRCPVCPAQGKAGCRLLTQTATVCTQRQIWNGDACMLQIHYPDDCLGLLWALRRQEQRMRAAEASRANACVAGATQACSDASAEAQREERFYQIMLEKYQSCEARVGTLHWGYNFAALGYSPWTLFDPLEADMEAHSEIVRP